MAVSAPFQNTTSEIPLKNANPLKKYFRQLGLAFMSKPAMKETSFEDSYRYRPNFLYLQVLKKYIQGLVPHSRKKVSINKVSCATSGRPLDKLMMRYFVEVHYVECQNAEALINVGTNPNRT
jgi:hypothetical protein